MDTAVLPLICPHGHGPGAAGSRFCTLCGAQLVAALAPASASVSAQPAPAANGAQPAANVPQPATFGLPNFSFSQPATVCKVCGGGGLRLDAAEDICTECGWLRPLYPGYELDRTVFLWAQDGQAMNTLHKMSSLSAIARSVSDKVGRPWIEATYNGIRLGPKQLPNVWKLAVLAARLLGVPYMPDVYVSGDSMWNTYTFGSDNSSFIVLGTAILTNFHNDDLLFVLAREMGHCRAGHALWKTVIRFVAGEMGPSAGLLSGGLLGAISPTKLIGGALEMPLMAWSRQSDVTADRAGLLAVGDEALARRVLLDLVHPVVDNPEAGQHRRVDEAGGRERRSVDPHLRNDDFVVDVYGAALAAAGSGGARAGADALEPNHPACAQTAFGHSGAGTQAGASRAGCQNRRAGSSAGFYSCGLQQVSERHAGPAGRSARQNVAERPLSAMPECDDVAVEINHPRADASRPAKLVGVTSEERSTPCPAIAAMNL